MASALKFFILLFPAILFSFFVTDPCAPSVSCRTAYTIHCTPETYCGTCLVFFHETSGAWTQPIGTIIPASTFDNPGFITDQCGFTIAITNTCNQRVTIKVIDNISFLVVTSGFAFLVRYRPVFNPA